MPDPIAQIAARDLRQNPDHADVPDEFWARIIETLSDSRYWVEVGVQVVPTYADCRRHIEEALAGWHLRNDALKEEGERMSEESEVLAASLADRPDEEIARALTDAPEGTNLAESPLGRRIIYEDDNPSRWASLCHQARQLLGGQGLGIEPSRRQADLAVEEANGMRRMPVGTWSIDHVEGLLRIAEVTTAKLPPDDPIRLEIKNRRLYHGGQAAISVGDFGKAAEYYRAAALIAATPFSRGLNAYFVAYCELQDALVRGDEEIVRARYYAFSGESEGFIAVLDRSIETQIRWLGNVRCHQRMFDWLCGDETRMANILSLVEVGELEPRAAFRDALELLGAVYLSRQDRYLSQVAYREAQSLAYNQDTAIEWRALAFLFLAEMEEGGGEQDRARATLNMLIGLEGHGGHVARAIARRRLEALAGEQERNDNGESSSVR